MSQPLPPAPQNHDKRNQDQVRREVARRLAALDARLKKLNG